MSPIDTEALAQTMVVQSDDLQEFFNRQETCYQFSIGRKDSLSLLKSRLEVFCRDSPSVGFFNRTSINRIPLNSHLYWYFLESGPVMDLLTLKNFSRSSTERKTFCLFFFFCLFQFRLFFKNYSSSKIVSKIRTLLKKTPKVFLKLHSSLKKYFKKSRKIQVNP